MSFTNQTKNIKVVRGKPTADTKGTVAHVFCVPEKSKSPSIKDKKTSDLIQARAKLQSFKFEADSSLSLDADAITRLHVFAIAKDKNTPMFADLSLARKIIATAKDVTPTLIKIDISSLPSSRQEQLCDAIASAASVSQFESPSFNKKKKESKKNPEVQIVTSEGFEDVVRRGATMGAATNLVRELTLLPANKLTCKAYIARAKKEAGARKLKTTVYSFSKLRTMGAGAFTAVAQGSDHEDSGIVKIEYKSSRKGAKNLSVVGKGIVFDTGGVNVKTGNFMFGMHGDMQGSAVALATVLLAAEQKWPINVTAWLAIADNAISNYAYRPNEVVTALNGTTIEVVHTDAEGRMCLADTLALATKSKPDLIVDFATLTGSAIYSIGTRFSAGFTNKSNMHQEVVDAGKKSGERVWTFPLEKDFEPRLKSEIADTKQCALERGPDHIDAAMFLSKFVDDTSWVHIDLSACENNGGLAHVPSTVTGFGVRFVEELAFQHFDNT